MWTSMSGSRAWLLCRCASSAVGVAMYTAHYGCAESVCEVSNRENDLSPGITRVGEKEEPSMWTSMSGSRTWLLCRCASSMVGVAMYRAHYQCADADMLWSTFLSTCGPQETRRRQHW
jgi:hypothetical protein